MELTDDEMKYIGTATEVLHAKTNLRRIAATTDDVFSCYTYTFEVKSGYQRYVMFSGEEIVGPVKDNKIHKSYTGRGIFPDFVGQEGIFTFWWIMDAKKHAEQIIKDIGDYVNLQWNDKELTISIKDSSKFLMEFEILPHNKGVYISIISRVQTI